MARKPGEPSLVIAKATPADLDEIVAIEQVSFRTPWSRESLADELDRPWSIFRVLRDPLGDVLAYLNYWVVYDEIHVLNVATRPEDRRRGYAQILLEEMIGLARRNGSREIHLEVRPSNAAARRLYEGLGFVQVGLRPGYYADSREDALLYQLRLTPDADVEDEAEEPEDGTGA